MMGNVDFRRTVCVYLTVLTSVVRLGYATSRGIGSFIQLPEASGVFDVPSHPSAYGYV